MYLEMGTIVQWAVPTVHLHPLHLHSSPYQLVYLPDWNNDSAVHNYTSFWEPGDWCAIPANLDPEIYTQGVWEFVDSGT
jgi:hypothetical protein